MYVSLYLYACVLCVCVCGCTCVCMWTPDTDIWYLRPLLFTFYAEAVSRGEAGSHHAGESG